MESWKQKRETFHVDVVVLDFLSLYIQCLVLGIGSIDDSCIIRFFYDAIGFFITDGEYKIDNSWLPVGLASVDGWTWLSLFRYLIQFFLNLFIVEANHSTLFTDNFDLLLA